MKRGDIASTGAAYARAAFGGAPGFGGPVAGAGADAVTASPYLGDDSLAPLVEHCASGKGVFVLTRTSNPGAALLQERESGGQPLYLHVADLVARLGADHVGDAGYSDVGAVAGATAPDVAASSSATRCRRRSCWCRASARRAPGRTPSGASRRATPPASWSTPRGPSSSPGRRPAPTTGRPPPRRPPTCDELLDFAL